MLPLARSVIKMARADKAAPRIIDPDELSKACQDVEAKIAKELKTWLHHRSKSLQDMVNALVLSYREEAEETLWQSISMIHAISKAEAKRRTP